MVVEQSEKVRIGKLRGNKKLVRRAHAAQVLAERLTNEAGNLKFCIQAWEAVLESHRDLDAVIRKQFGDAPRGWQITWTTREVWYPKDPQP